jgi:hypothetical protein
VDKSGRDIRINTFVNKDIICDHLFGYISGVLRRIYNNLQMPEYFVLNETQAVRHHMKINSKFLCLYGFYNMKNPQ